MLDDGTVLTETAAIALFLSDRATGLAPAVGTTDRNKFYCLLIWLVANVYPTFTYGDYPERRAPSAPGELDDATARYREKLYLWLEEQVANLSSLAKMSALSTSMLRPLSHGARAWNGSSRTRRNSPG